MAKKENPNKNKHLTGEQRKEVEECLAKRMTFKAIGRFLEKDPTTISYEVKHHRTEHRNGFTKETGTCPRLLKAPYVCNGCPQKHSASCRYVRYYYRAEVARSSPPLVCRIRMFASILPPCPRRMCPEFSSAFPFMVLSNESRGLSNTS